MYARNVRQTSSMIINDGLGLTLKMTTIVLNIILFLLAIGILGFGIYLAVWTRDYSSLNVITNDSNYEASYILLIISGVIIVIVAFIGLCGSQQESSCQLLTFLCAAIISAIMLIAAAVLAIVFNQQIVNHLNTEFTSSLKTYYGINLKVDRYKEITDAIDGLQKKYLCCGVAGEINSTSSWFMYRSSAWWFTKNKKAPFVPESCCKLNSAGAVENLQVCQGSSPYKGSTDLPPNVRNTKDNPFLHTRGCLTVMNDSVTYFTWVIFGLGIASAIFIIFIVILSCIVLRKIEVGRYEMQFRSPSRPKQPPAVYPKADYVNPVVEDET